MPPGVTFEDTGMIAAACFQFGILHPPGYPLYAMLCPSFAHIADVSPLNPAQATALLSALCAAAACAFFYEIARRFGAQKAVALPAALTLGLGARFWSQAIIPEVYTLNALLTAATLAAVLRIVHFPSRSRWLWLCFLAGLGLANHWPLYASAAPAFALFLAGGRRRWRPQIRPGVAGAAMFAAGLSPYLYLLLRPHWGETLSLTPPPENFHEWISYISREIYTAKDALRISDGADCVRSALWSLRLLANEYTVIGAAAAVIGFAMFCRRRPFLQSLAVLYGVASAPLLAGYLCFDIDEGVTKTTLAAYPLPAAMFVMLCITAALNRIPAPGHIVAAAALAAATGAYNWAGNDRSGDRFAEEYAAAVLDSLPPNSAFVIDSDWSFPVFYRRHALGVRRDVVVAGDLTLPPSAAGRRMFSADYVAGERFRDWGVIQELLSGGAAEFRPIPPPLIHFYRRLSERRAVFYRETRQYDKTAELRALFAAGRALTSAKIKNGNLTPEAEKARAAIVQTPAGLFGKLDARARGGVAKILEIRAMLSVLRRAEESFPPAWRAQLRHREGVLHFLAGRKRAAKAQWREAVDLDTKSPALIDLLHSLAAEREWREYGRLRRRFWMVENPALRDTDAACVAAGICAAAEIGGNRLK